MWHSLRRKWATERKDYPVRDVAEAGGWRDLQTLLRSYQQADDETLRQVVLMPMRRLGEQPKHGNSQQNSHAVPSVQQD